MIPAPIDQTPGRIGPEAVTGGTPGDDGYSRGTSGKVPRAGTELDTTRSLIRERADYLGITLSDLSRALKRSPGYIHVFLYRGSPPRLTLEQRVTLGELLNLDPEELDPRTYRAPTRASAKTDSRAYPTPAAEPRPVRTDIPLFRQSELIEPADAREWTPRPSTSPGSGGMFAVEVQEGCIRARPGDILYVAQRTPRVGDLAVCVRDRRIEAIGELSDINATIVRMQVGATYRELRLRNLVLFKVAALVCR